MADGTTPGGGPPPNWSGPNQAPGGPYSQPRQNFQPQQPPQPPQPPRPQQPQQWAHNAANDPWRNPTMPAVVQRTPQPQLPPIERPEQAQRKTPAHLALTISIATVVAILAGVLSAWGGLLIMGDATGTMATSDASNKPRGDFQEIIAQVKPSVVTINVESGDAMGNGSGWVYSSEGYIVTNDHVASLAKDDSDISVQLDDGRSLPAEIVGSAKSTDIAVLKVDAELEPLSVQQDTPQVGDSVIAVGSPLGLANTVTDGIVSAVDRPVAAGQSEEDAMVVAAIQTDAAINPGNSGGPLLNSSGEVIGVNTLIYGFSNDQGEAGSMGLGFAISITQAERVAKQIIDDGKATKTVLGTELQERTSSSNPGAVVDDVQNNTPADDAGLKADDVITKFNDVTLTSEVQLQALVLKAAPGDVVTLTYERDGKENTAKVELGAASD